MDQSEDQSHSGEENFNDFDNSKTAVILLADQIHPPLFKCLFCTELFDCTENLKIHLRNHVRKNVSNDNQIQGSLDSMVNHSDSTVQNHTGNVRGSPVNCQKRVSRFKTLEKKHKCEFCEKSFRLKQGLKLHTRIHTGEKPYKCSYCEKSFTQKPSLTEHTRIHTGVKPFKCTYCEKCCISSPALTKHRRIHTGEKPYKCETCKKLFSQRSTLTKHIIIHTRVNSVKSKKKN